MRTIHLFNTLTRCVEPVTPVEPGVVKIYNCGPTIYSFAHIGNLRTFLFQDILRRTFAQSGFEVRFCMNLTDVEDKIIRDSQKDLPKDADNESRMKAMRDFTDRYEKLFLEDPLRFPPGVRAVSENHLLFTDEHHVQPVHPQPTALRNENPTGVSRADGETIDFHERQSDF
ncbi:MAG: hypothetical protein LBH03_03685, partial [Holophagales bacterium]|nr:hypothetical protein [Holophagales bacterium]